MPGFFPTLVSSLCICLYLSGKTSLINYSAKLSTSAQWNMK